MSAEQTQKTRQLPKPPASGQPNTGMHSYNMKTYFGSQFAVDAENFQAGGRLKSGYPNLDLITNLYPGLYVIGAISSLGKTTFVHQMCDQIAESGSSVLFISLEQSALELASKTISRTIAKMDAEHGLTSLQIRRCSMSDPRIQAAMDKCMGYAGRITVAECSFQATIHNISAQVRNYINKYNTKPVVVIDYLQVIQADPESHMTARDLVDFHVRVLKKLQSDYQLTMIVVSSLNRQNYMTTIDFESFKESGGIEYTADVLWGLQLQCIHEEIFSKQNKINEKRQRIVEAKRANPRKIELVCLKNRFGVSSYTCHFDYYPNYDLFEADPSDLVPENISDGSTDTDGWTELAECFQIPFEQ